MRGKKNYTRYTMEMVEYYETHEMCDGVLYEVNILKEVSFYEEIRDIRLDDLRELYDKFE